MEENVIPANIYLMTRSQVITVNGHVLDISIPAVTAVMDMYDVPKDKRYLMLKRIKALWYERNEG